MEPDEPNDRELFDITDIAVSYQRSRDQTRVSILLKSEKPISEMKLYLILGMELDKLERRLGISGMPDGMQ